MAIASDRFYFLDTDSVDWQDSSVPGIRAKVLSRHPLTGQVVFLARFDAGSTYARHDHPAGEEVYVLSGEFVDGERAYGPGTFIHYPPGTVHEPHSPQGCVILVVLPATPEG